MFLIVRQIHPVEHIEYKTQDHTGDAGQNHAGELHVAEVYLDSGQTGDKDDGSQGLVAVYAVVHLGIHQNPQAGGSDHTVE